jgi:hypothetical protein
MANVTNKHSAPLTMGGVTIPAGRTAKVENWRMVSGGSAVRTWLKLGIIEADEDPAERGLAGLKRADLQGFAAGPAQTEDAPTGAYAVKATSPGWFAVFDGDKQVTKGLRKDDVSGFDEFSDADKAAFVEANKVED